MKKQLLNTFQNGMNSNSHHHFIGDGEIIDSFNLESITQGSEGGIRKRIDGNESVSFSGIWTLPDGDNICIGKIDNRKGSAITFWKNENDNDFICVDSEIIRVSDQFSFSDIGLITHSSIVDERYLIWTDFDIDAPTDSQSNPVRLLDLTKTSFKSSYVSKIIPFTYDKTYEFSVASVIQVTPISIAGVAGTPSNIVVDGSATGGGLKGSMQWLANYLNTVTFNGITNTTAMYRDDNTIDIITDTTSPPNQYYQVTNILGTEIFSYPVNFHRNDLSEYCLNLYPYAPLCPPLISTREKYTKGTSIFQFRYRYVYDDNRKSAWSDISLSAFRNKHNFIYDTQSIIDVEIDDSKLTNVDFRGTLKRIEVACREGDNGVWRKFETLQNHQLGDGTNIVAEFQSGKTYPVIASDDVSTADIQNLKLFESLPIVAKTIDVASDSTGGTRLFIGGGQEGYDLPEIDIETNPVYNKIGIDNMIRIEGTVSISAVSGYSSKPDFESYNGGFPVYLAGTPFFGFSDNPNNDSGATGTFSFYAPKGKYILRVGSWKCRYDDENGSIFNVSNGLQWQNTSSPVLEIDGLGVPEKHIDTTGLADGATLNIGVIDIHNQHFSVESITHLNGYVKDNFGNWETSDIRQKSVGMPIQSVTVADAGAGLKTYITDHNGYFFLAYERGGNPRFSAQDLNIEIADNTSTQNLDWVDFEGDEASVFGESDTLVQTVSSGGIYNPAYTNGYITIYADLFSQTENIRKQISGTVLDVNNNVPEGVSVVMQRGGLSNIRRDGKYAIVGFTPFNNAGVLNVRLYANKYFDLKNQSSFTTNPSAVTPIAWATKTGTINFELLNFYLSEIDRYLKAGGSYNIGIGYADKFGRKTPVIPVDNVNLDWHTSHDDMVQCQIGLTISHYPPEFAEKLIVYRGKNDKQLNYSQLRVADVQYANISDEGNVMYSLSSSASHILIRLQSGEVFDNTTDGLVLFGNNTERVGYPIEESDRIRLIHHQNGEFFDNDIDLSIKGSFLDNDSKKWWVVENITTEELMSGDLVEAYTPSTVESDFYYMDSCYDIITSGNDRYHGGDTNQSGVSDAVIKLKGGDTYWRYRDYISKSYTTPYPLENKNITDVVASNVEDIGIPNTIDEDYNSDINDNTVRFSNIFTPASNKNGIGSWGVFDYINIGSENGAINALKNVNNNLLAICSYNTQPIYIGKSALLDLSGTSQVGRSSAVLNLANETVLRHGTQNPESVAVHDNKLFCYDKNRKRFWLFSSNGTNWINGKYDEAISEKIDNSVARVIGCIDEENDIYKVMLSPYLGDLNYTSEVLNFDYIANKWDFREEVKSNYIWFDTRYGIRTDFDNKIWNHYQSDSDLIYGDEILSHIEYATKGFSGDIRPLNILINSNKIPSDGEIVIKPSNRNPLEQKTLLVSALWIDTMNKLNCNIPRNINDRRYNIGDTDQEIANAMWNGNILHGETMRVKLSFDSKVELINSVIFGVETVNT